MAGYPDTELVADMFNGFWQDEARRSLRRCQ
jgi:hypothetical protein